MNIVYSSSDSYAEICGISIISLLENNKAVERINFYIIDNGISDQNKSKLEKTIKNYGRAIVFVPRPDLEKTFDNGIFVGRWNIGTFFRLYLGSLLPKNLDKVIYLDCDTIVRKSLSEIFELDIGGHIVAGVDDCRSDLYRIDIGCCPGTVYINNGFLLIDLAKWREERIEERVTRFILERKGNVTYMDQAPLNGVLGPKNQIFELPPIYNAQRVFFDFSYKELLRLRRPSHHLSEEDYEMAISDPIVVHFTPVFISGTRPWQKKDKHKFKKEYDFYKSISAWKTEPYRADDRKWAKKLMTFLCRCCPKFILIPIMSYLHAVWYPKKRIKIAASNKQNKSF